MEQSVDNLPTRDIEPAKLVLHIEAMQELAKDKPPMVVPDKPAMGGVLVAELALVLDILVAPVELADVPSNFVPSAPNKHGAESHNVAPSPP